MKVMKGLSEIVFSKESRVQEICGFSRCLSLLRIEIPSSVEMIEGSGFDGCTSLNEVFFSPVSQLKTIAGFRGCTSLVRVEIPSSVKIIRSFDFANWT
jgi:hypothetical protein